MKRPRVLVVGPTPPPFHGGSVATRLLLDSRLAQDFELTHLDTADRRGAENSGRLELTNIWLALRHGAEFLYLFLRHRPDIVYVPVAQNALAFLRDSLFFLPPRLAGTPIVVHVHGGYFGRFYEESPALLKPFIRWIFRGVRRGIVLGEALRGMLEPVLPARRVAVVPNGVPDFGGGAEEAGGGATASTDGAARVVYLGTLMESKGFLDVLEAAKLLNGKAPAARFVFAGDFHLPRDRSRAAAYGGLAGRAEFVGIVDGKAKERLLRDADVFVFPTFYPYEGHPYVILEAMAAGLPVISTDQGAIAETVVDGVTGVLVPKSSPAALAHAIGQLLADAERRRAMGRAGRARYEALYTVERWAERMGAVFTEALGEEQSEERAE